MQKILDTITGTLGKNDTSFHDCQPPEIQSNTFIDAYDEKVRPLMDKIDQIRSLLSWKDLGITFPNVVVVGDQSSGKSTLLEALSLVELPKGSGIVTRCPLVLRLRKSNVRRLYRLNGKNKIELDEKANSILKYIEAETEKLAGGNKNVVRDLIELQVDDPNVRDLTVIDLPGIARNPIADQPKDIHQQTTDLIRHYIRQEGSVILCVFPANVDIGTVESFTIAHEFDPTGERTIGVITKSDLAPSNDVLLQQLQMDRSDIFQLKLGFIAVRNRSTEENISLNDARKREKEFFEEHYARVISEDRLGIEALTNRLADLYSDRVKEAFPKLKAEVKKKLNDICEKLARFPPHIESNIDKSAKYFELSEWYIENIIKKRLTNTSDGQNLSMINKLVTKLKQVQDFIEIQNQDIFSVAYCSRVQKSMAACIGEQLPNFLPHSVLKQFISEKLDKLWEVIKILINESFQMTLESLTHKDVDACRGNILLDKLIPIYRSATRTYLEKKKETICGQINELIRLEKLEPYTLNSYYIRRINRFKYQPESRNSANKNRKILLNVKNADNKDQECTNSSEDDDSIFYNLSHYHQEVQEMIMSISFYWNVLSNRLMDYTALTIRAGFIFDICSDVRQYITKIAGEKSDFFETVFTEDKSTRHQREQLQEYKFRLDEASRIINDYQVYINGDDTFVCGVNSFEDSNRITLDELTGSTTHPHDNDIPSCSIPLIKTDI